jgi:hypothetical protein
MPEDLFTFCYGLFTLVPQSGINSATETSLTFYAVRFSRRSCKRKKEILYFNEYSSDAKFVRRLKLPELTELDPIESIVALETNVVPETIGYTNDLRDI